MGALYEFVTHCSFLKYLFKIIMHKNLVFCRSLEMSKEPLKSPGSPERSEMSPEWSQGSTPPSATSTPQASRTPSCAQPVYGPIAWTNPSDALNTCSPEVLLRSGGNSPRSPTPPPPPTPASPHHKRKSTKRKSLQKIFDK